MKRIVVGSLIITCLICLAYFAPWINARTAGELAELQYNAAWSFVADGCGTQCDRCGTSHFEKVPFGGYVTIHYRCGLYSPSSPMYSKRVYISFLGTLHGSIRTP